MQAEAIKISQYRKYDLVCGNIAQFGINIVSKTFFIYYEIEQLSVEIFFDGNFFFCFLFFLNKI